MSLRMTYKQAILSLFVLHALALALFAGFRVVDYDEGFYLSAAHMVAQGHSLYSDFFYPQMPFLPYILAPLSGHGFASLYLSRFAGVLAAVLASVLFYLMLRRLCRDQRMQILIFAFYVFSGPVLSWHSVAKTYPWTDLFLFAAVYLLMISQTSGRLRPLLFAGVFTGLAINTRLLFIPLVILFGTYISITSRTQPLRRLAVYIAAVVLVSLPSCVLLIRHPDQFFFDNFGFHLMRAPQTVFPQTIIDRLVVFGKLVASPQILVILALAGVAFWSWRKTKETAGVKSIAGSPAGLVSLTAVAITVIYLIPSPIHHQYFVQAIPFALLACAAGLNEFPGRLASFITRPRVKYTLVAIYLLGVVPYGIYFIGGIRPLDHFNTIANVRRVCEYLQSGKAQGSVLAECPIFPTLSDCAFPAEAAFVGNDYKLPLTDDQKRFYRLPTDSDLIALLADKAIARLVVRDYPDSALQPMVAQNYVQEKSFDRYVVYGRK